MNRSSCLQASNPPRACSSFSLPNKCRMWGRKMSIAPCICQWTERQQTPTVKKIIKVISEVGKALKCFRWLTELYYRATEPWELKRKWDIIFFFYGIWVYSGKTKRAIWKKILLCYTKCIKKNPFSSFHASLLFSSFVYAQSGQNLFITRPISRLFNLSQV